MAADLTTLMTRRRYVEELVLELVKGPAGYGMAITESGHVVGNTPGGVAEAAGTLARDPSRCLTRLAPQLTGGHGGCVVRCTEVPTEHCKIKVVNNIPVNGKAEIVAALGKPPAGEHGGALFEFALGVNKYRKAELLRDEGEKLFEEKQYEAAMSLLIDAGNLYVRSHTPPLHAVPCCASRVVRSLTTGSASQQRSREC